MINTDNKITILGKDYYIIDVIDKITIADSFVARNKIGSGNGEAKLYIGPRKLSKKYLDFFDNFSDSFGFFIKKDLINYLHEAEIEYQEQGQGYKHDISEFYIENLEKAEEFKDIEYFDIKESEAGGNERFYLKNSDSKIYKFFRIICLPVITYISIIKLFDIELEKNFYYYRPFLDYFNDKRNTSDKIKDEYEKINILKNETNTEKDILAKARIGQGKYRENLIEEFPSGCLITNITDERLLIASHIKPWSVSNNKERVDRYNGLLLSPTYDRLFDQGFITFSNDGIISISPYISPQNWKRINLKNGTKYDLKQNNERSQYLEYHRSKIFKGIID